MASASEKTVEVIKTRGTDQELQCLRRCTNLNRVVASRCGWPVLL